MKVFESISPRDAQPYIFPMSSQKIYSYEGLVYYCIHHAMEGIAEFKTTVFCDFIENKLGLSDIAKRLMEILAKDQREVEQYVEFLSLSPIVSQENLQYVCQKLCGYMEKSPAQKLKEHGDEAFTSGNYLKAIQYYQKALALEYNPFIMHNLGAVYVKLQEYEAAENAFLDAIRHEDHPKFYVNYLRLFKIRNQIREGIIYAKGVLLRHEDGDIYEVYGDLLVLNRDFNAALEVYLKAYEIHPKKEVWIKILEVSIEVQDLNEVLTHIESIREENEEVYGLLKAGALSRLKKNHEAIEVLEQVLTKGYVNKSIYIKLCRLYVATRQIIKAIQVISLAAEHFDLDDELLYEMAQIAKRAGNRTDYLDKIQLILKKWKASVREMVHE